MHIIVKLKKKKNSENFEGNLCGLGFKADTLHTKDKR